MALHTVSLPPYEDGRCNICDGIEFTLGPRDRKSSAGKLPRCGGCRSLERHRQLREVYGRVPPAYLERLDALQVSPDIGVEPGWFKSFEVSVFQGENSLDLEAIDRPDASYDLVVCNHVLEHVKDDRKGFRELMRILRPDGFLQVTVPTPYTRDETLEFGYPDQSAFGHWRAYGKDLVERFQQIRHRIHALQVEAFDPATGGGGYVYLWSMDETTISELARWVFNRSRLAATRS